MRIVERTVLAVLLAATLATLLLVARNGLVPAQHPVSFGLVLWAWVLLFYSAVGLAALALAGLVSKLPRLARLPGWLLLVATLLFTAVALASNPRALSSVVALGGPGLFRLLLPVSAALCALALVAVGVPLARGAAWIRIGVLIALVSGLLSLLPVGGAGNARGGASPSARLQGLRFVVVGVDGADWRLMEPVTMLVQALSEWRGGDLALFAHYMDPHYPYDPPPSYAGLFPNDGADAGGGGGSRASVEALYDGELAYTDSQIDLLLKELERRGLLRDAVIVYTADHGEEFLDHGGWRHSRTLYQEMLHVPLAVRLPGVGGRRITEKVSLVDLAPTLLGALGIPAPASCQGRSLLPLVRGERLPAREVFAETERNLKQAHRLAAGAAVGKGGGAAGSEGPAACSRLPSLAGAQLQSRSQERSVSHWGVGSK
jgi:sulfatase-like protein